jgi:hypothetical protein
MKPDEEFAIKHLKQHLGLGNALKFIEGSDPPDCFGIFCMQRVGIEITRIGAVHIKEDLTIMKRDFDYAISKWSAEGKKEIEVLIPSDCTLCCHVKGPIEDFSKFKKKFAKKIKELLDTNQIQQEAKEFKIESASVDLCLRPRKGSLAVIMTSGVVEHNLPLQASLDIQAGASISMAIKDKEHKCRNFKERAWLLLINTNVLIDQSDLKGLDLKNFEGTFFEKIFVVDPEGKVLLIFQKQSESSRILNSFLGWFKTKVYSSKKQEQGI